MSSENAYTCQVCNTLLPSHRARVHCRTCSDYDACADCHVTESVSGTHCAEHGYEVHLQGSIVLVKEGSVPASKKTLDEASAETPALRDVLASETYWGQLITPTKAPSPIFSRLITAIFTHFDTTSAGGLQPSEFCALMFASGYSPEQFPPLQVSTNESASPADLHELDAWLANWFRSFPLDHRTTTREFPPPPPIEPVNGRIRMRDQFLHGLMYPAPPVVPNGLPILSRLGLEQFYVHEILRIPEEIAVHLNHLLGTLARLTDPETGRVFETQLLPRACFPLLSDAEEEEKRRMLEKQQAERVRWEREAALEAEHQAHIAIMTGMKSAGGLQ
ncbi:hypothetical protein C8A00DRAFT_17878 [Chaetomidium leptoderma]|uniref:ZZ-type domain-containing protein n=1 Tax=Chaetomidium leptoderma TaxID=669021 RepID=A0AAN6ZVR2_9PEZI|nr:hypothetical protein C8A00DRAFT_17878 [Chaetomidium leptoderma]